MSQAGSTTEEVLTARDLYRFYRSGAEETLALRGVSLSLRRGETLAVIGPSGSGKSTLLACLAGLDEPDGGYVYVGGERVSHLSEGERARVRARRIGVLLQSGNLLPHLDLGGNILLARSAARATRTPSRRSGIGELLDQVGLGARRRALPRELAGGERARAGLAVALANEPDVLLADEPTGELDGPTEQRILDLLQDRAQRGAGVLLVTHSRRAVRIADRTIALRDGRIRP
ncbi:ABC transporter ATP-binding protein [Streptomyces sp. NPDC059982]|uniref:ABC transporter ATP-binding protein n=1 Tax=unclassified Streptomyces TaxID=2593676 RepID=UPI00343C9354